MRAGTGEAGARVVFAGFLFAAVASAALSQEQAANEAALLRGMPTRLLERIASGCRPDGRGLAGRNRDGWLHVSFQREAMLYLAVAAAYGDVRRAAAGWRAVDAAFRRQNDAGSFDVGTFEGRRPRLGDDLSGTSFWLGELCHALLVVKESPTAARSEGRIRDLLPRIRRSAEWLAQHEDALFAYDQDAPNRLFFDAQTFAFAGLLLGEPRFNRVGRRFLDAGLALQREDGAFVEQGGHDSSYQAVALLKLQYYALRVPDPTLHEAARRGAEWLIARIGPNGAVDVTGNTRTGMGQERFLGREKDVNYSEVVLALLYYAEREGDDAAAEAAQRAFDYAAHRRNEPDSH